MKNELQLNTAMILAAGFGTRLKPLTDVTPKALVVYDGRPMIYHVIKKLEGFGIGRIIINIHHLADKLIEYFDKNKFGPEIILLKEEKILGTGGAIKNAEQLLRGSGNFIVHNADVNSAIDLKNMFGLHIESDSFATLAVKKRNTSRYLLADSSNELIGRTEDGKEVFYRQSLGDYYRTAFCGISILNEKIFEYLPPVKKYDIIPEIMKLVEIRKKITVFDIGEVDWQDMGNQIIDK